MKRILIVDDDEHIRKMLSRFFKSEGYDVALAADGNEAIKSYHAHHPDLVIMDIIMPEREGMETIVELRHLSPDFKVIAISGGGEYTTSEENLEMAESLGAVRIVQKPIMPDELLKMVEELI